MERFGARLQHAREARSLTQAKLAKEVGVSRTYIANVENSHGGALPGRDLCHRIADALDLYGDDVFEATFAERIPQEVIDFYEARQAATVTRYEEKVTYLLAKIANDIHTEWVFGLPEDAMCAAVSMLGVKQGLADQDAFGWGVVALFTTAARDPEATEALVRAVIAFRRLRNIPARNAAIKALRVIVEAVAHVEGTAGEPPAYMPEEEVSGRIAAREGLTPAEIVHGVADPALPPSTARLPSGRFRRRGEEVKTG